MKPYNILKIKNALVNSVYHVMEYIILCSHSSVAEESSPVKCDTLSTDKLVPTFAKSILPASLVCNSPSQTLLGLIDPDHGGSMLLYNTGNYLSVNIKSYHKIL
jgi:hypothetical protein